MTSEELSRIKQRNVDIFRETEKYIRDGKSVLTASEMEEAIFIDEQEAKKIREENLSFLQATDHETYYGLRESGTAYAALTLEAHHYQKILFLNFASSTHPGGGVRHGARAQEETLCRQTTLLHSLESDEAKAFYRNHRDYGTYLATDAMILSPKVQILRNDRYEWVEKTVVVSALTCAAPHLHDNTHDSEEFLSELYYNRILSMICVAAKYGYRSLVFGAWGCGAFKNDPKLVADAFCRALTTFRNKKMGGKDFFDIVFFAIPDAKGRNYQEFDARVMRMNAEMKLKSMATNAEVKTESAGKKMNSVSIQKISITDVAADCIVNAANEHLAEGGGVCGAIFRAAGPNSLTRACKAIGGCKTGDAVITPAFQLNAKYIIHAVGPVWNGGEYNEPEQLQSCYRRALELAKENDCHSIAFPLISAGIFGYPKELAWRTALMTCNTFLRENPDYGLEVIFAVRDDAIIAMGKEEQERLDQEFLEALKETKNVMLFGCPELEAALEEWKQGGKKNPTPVLVAMAKGIAEEMEVVIPIEVLEGQEQDDGSLPIKILNLERKDGTTQYPIFTSMDEITKGPETSMAPQLLKTIAEIAYSEENCSGLALNPWSEDGMDIPREALGIMLGVENQALKDLHAGSEAYQKGDYATAIAYYQKAADAGNVEALSNLGYCYYYGRSIPVNKYMAHLCWEKAALYGDVCATYKLGDMYRNGDLVQDFNFSKAMYRRAFEMSQKDRDIYCYPDACLRILKYCKDECPADLYAEIARDAVDGFRARIDDGDNYTDDLYQQATEILNGLETK